MGYFIVQMDIMILKIVIIKYLLLLLFFFYLKNKNIKNKCYLLQLLKNK